MSQISKPYRYGVVMQEVASDNGMAPVAGKSEQRTTDVGGLIAAVESKMAELMAWHAQQVRQLETDKTVLSTQVEQQHQALSVKRVEIDSERSQLDAFRQLLDKRDAELEDQRKILAERIEQINNQRIKLVDLTSKLRAEESAMSREWTAVQQERESIQRQAEELAARRVRIDERAKVWLDETAKELATPLKLADADTGSDKKPSDRSAA